MNQSRQLSLLVFCLVAVLFGLAHCTSSVSRNDPPPPPPAAVPTTALAEEAPSAPAPDPESAACITCHEKTSPALVMEWKRSQHAKMGIGCFSCHSAAAEDPDAWLHEGKTISVLVTPKDCAKCHEKETTEFSQSHHAQAGEILASIDNVLADKVIGMPGHSADSASGCLQCHGSIIKFAKDENGQALKTAEGEPIIDSTTWPNSGIGRLNPDGSKGSCHACHSRHSFESSLARQPENCGKCHMGPDHPQIEIYNESKHGVAFRANIDLMNLDKEGDWVLGRDYSAAPTCTTCHMGSYQTKDGVVAGNSHNVGDRISWTLRPVVSVKLNRVIYEDGFQEDLPDSVPLPSPGDVRPTTEHNLKEGSLISQSVERKVARVMPWTERRENMKVVCRNCHDNSHVENFYAQFDDLIVLYNEKFAKPAKAIMGELEADGVLDPKKPFSEHLQWIYFELWHHEGRRARHGVSMMGPDYTHWHGMYEVAKNFYFEFLPGVIDLANEKSPELGEKYKQRVDALKAEEGHRWLEGLSEEEAAALKAEYNKRYGQ